MPLDVLTPIWHSWWLKALSGLAQLKMLSVIFQSWPVYANTGSSNLCSCPLSLNNLKHTPEQGLLWELSTDLKMSNLMNTFTFFALLNSHWTQSLNILVSNSIQKLWLLLNPGHGTNLCTVLVALLVRKPTTAAIFAKIWVDCSLTRTALIGKDSYP